jgi:predicted DNA binding CopG/RHH family protein
MKSVPFKMPRVVNPDSADQWVSADPRAPEQTPVAAAAPPDVPMKRFTIDVSEDLHRRIKAQCAVEGLKMADVLREILEARFPAKS